MKIGVLGYADYSGLGTMTAALIRNLGAVRHLAPSNKGKTGVWPQDLAPETRRCETWTPPSDAVDWFLSGLDCVLTVETDYGTALAAEATKRGVKAVHIPMWEYWGDPPIYPGYSAYFAVSKYGYRCIPSDWPRHYLPWPIDLAQFPFTPRGVTSGPPIFLHAAGHTVQSNRKGTAQVIRGFAQTTVEATLLLLSQRPLSDFPDDCAALIKRDRRIVLVDRELPNPQDCYATGDFFVFPSRLEGHAMVTLEAMACGLVPITTDAAPMNEFDLPASCYLPAFEAEHGHFQGMNFPKWEVSNADMAKAFVDSAKIPVRDWSTIMRNYIASCYSWQALGALWRSTLERACA